MCKKTQEVNMARKGREKSVCKTTAKVIGSRVTVKTTCLVKPKVVKVPCGKRKKYTKAPVPRICKGLKGRALDECKRIIHKKYTL
jgi:hypothetical protein